MASADMMALIKGAKNKYTRTDSKVVKVKEGKMDVVVLNKGGKFWQDRGLHWIKENDDRGTKPEAVAGCSRVAFDMPCDICNAAQKAIRAQTDDESLKIAKQWTARESVLIVGYITSGPDKGDEPQIIEVTKGLFGDIMKVMEEWGPDQNLVLERTGKSITDTKYSAMASPRAVKVPAGIQDKMPDLEAFIKKEDFRGEEAKAINAIAGFTGLALSAPTRGAGLLTSAASKVPDDSNLTAKALNPPAASVPKAAPKHDEEPVVDKTAPTVGAAEADAPATAPDQDSFDQNMDEDELNRLLGSI